MDKQTNLAALMNEINWLQQVVEQVMKTYFVQEGYEMSWTDLPIPDLSDNESVYAQTVIKYDLQVYDRLALALALAPSLQPEVLDIFFVKDVQYDRMYTQFGGLTNSAHCGFLPTGQTLCFLTGSALRLEVLNTLHKDRALVKEKIIILGQTDPLVPPMNGVLAIHQSWLHYFITGEQVPV